MQISNLLKGGILAILVLAYSCKSGHQAKTGLGDTAPEKYLQIQPGFVHSIEPDFSVDTAFVKNDSLLLVKISFQGGCNGFHFDLMNDGNIQKSMPPRTNLILVHSSQLENCKDSKQTWFTFNLSPLKNRIPKKNKLLLKLSNWKGVLEMKEVL
ncbi:MAG: hypothetical protein K1X82_04940 [Bacteroidia bacterium]|nr:hypothetical protein [Bacteroidia bacterium]